MIAPNQLVSLWDMLELHAPSFLGAATEIARLRQIMVGIEESTERHQSLHVETVTTVKPRIEGLYQEADKIGAKLACVSAERLYGRVLEDPCTVTLVELSDALRDIESRFADHLSFVKLFVIPEDRAILFGGAETLLKPTAAQLYTSLWFDCEEAAKCLCLGRSTACVFHTMRMLEIAIAAISKRLGIPDPAKVDPDRAQPDIANREDQRDDGNDQADPGHPSRPRRPAHENEPIAEPTSRTTRSPLTRAEISGELGRRPDRVQSSGCSRLSATKPMTSSSIWPKSS